MAKTITYCSVALAGVLPAMVALDFACHPGGANPPPPGPPSVFVVDSTGTLFSFDVHGNSLASVALPTPIGPLNGGGITGSPSEPTMVSVTIGAPTNSVVTYSEALVESPAMGHPGFQGALFGNLDAPRGIAASVLHHYRDGVSSLLQVLR